MSYSFNYVIFSLSASGKKRRKASTPGGEAKAETPTQKPEAPTPEVVEAKPEEGEEGGEGEGDDEEEEKAPRTVSLIL